MQSLGTDWEFVDEDLAGLLQLSEADFVKDPSNMVALAKIRNLKNSAPPLQGYDGESKKIKEILSMKVVDFQQAMKDDPAYFQSHPILTLWADVKKVWGGDSGKNLKDAAARIVHSHCMDAMVPLVKEYREKKTARGEATMNDLLLRIRDMLRDNPEARAYFHDRYQVLYVDEFQDTDPVQAEMLFYLTADPATIDTTDWRNCKPVPGSLFLVGDPKQAIYRFRGADIDVYNIVKEAFEQGSGEVRKLQFNFRSSKAVCDWTKKLFQPPDKLTVTTAKKYFSPKDGNYQNPKQAEYEDMLAEQGDVDGSYLFSYEAINGSGTDPEQVAAFIRTMVDKKVTVPDKNGGHPAQWSDFLLLTPKKKMIKEYVRALAELDIPLNVAGEQKLIEVEPVRKAVLHLRSMVENQDDMALIQVLTDCYQIPLEDMRLFLQRTKMYNLRAALSKNKVLSVKAALEEETPQHAGLIRLCDVLWELAELRKLTKKIPAMSVIERLMDDGYGIWNAELELQQRKQEYGRVQQYLDVVRSGPQHSFPALAAHAIACAETSADYELSLQEEKNQVQVMNLHKSKGLEGNIVILANGTLPKRVQRHVSRDPHAKEYFCIMSDNSSIGWPKDWNGAELQTAKKDDPKRVCKKIEEGGYLDAERLRLLYVAVTRAAYWLVVCAKPPKKDKESRSGETAWQKISDTEGFQNVKSIEDNTKDAALKAALESLRTGKHQYQKVDKTKLPVKEVSMKQLTEEKAEVFAFCDGVSSYHISPSRLDAASRSVKRRQEKVDDDTAVQNQNNGNAVIVTQSNTEPHGADWGTIVHRVMELAVREQQFDDLKPLAVQAVNETLGDVVLDKVQKKMLLAGNDMSHE
ncbi:MAG: UvrD-helicase domain-containing protein, partial [Anaerotignum sp.]|nr:UvrD-helicase domain-containing protein [Anaerotignum sp.]